MINLLPKEVDEGNDEMWRYPWQCNIAMLFHDKYGITDWDKGNQAATDILNMIYEAKWEPIDYRKDKASDMKDYTKLYDPSDKNEGCFKAEARQRAADTLVKCIGAENPKMQKPSYLGEVEVNVKEHLQNRPPVYKSLDALFVRVDLLKEKIYKLEDVLSPALSQCPVVSEKENIDVECFGNSDIARNISNACSGLLELEQRIKTILERLEV